MFKFSRGAALRVAVFALATSASVGAAVATSTAVPHPASTSSAICRSSHSRSQVDQELMVMLRRDVHKRYRPALWGPVWRELTRHPAAAYRMVEKWSHVRVVAVTCGTANSRKTAFAIVTVSKPASFVAKLITASKNGLRIGIADPNLYYKGPATQAAHLTDMKNNLHVSSVRIDVSWPNIQPSGPTSFDWSQLDQTVAAIRAHGLSIDFIIDGCAPWASASGNWWAQPSDPTQFATFAGEVAARYGSSDGSTFEIWNEPNLDIFWYPAANAQAYTTLLIDASAAIKAADPGATVISGGLSNGGTPSGASGGIDPITFLNAMYAGGAKSSFDAVGFHPYGWPLLPNQFAPWNGWSMMNATTSSIRSVMIANGDGAKKVDITEVGWPSNEPSSTGIAGPNAQADEFQQALSFAMANSWIGSIYLFTYQDNGVSTTNTENNFGLITASGARKPAYFVLAG